jgi:hypothetical protein
MACRISHSESCYCYRSRAWRLAAWPPRANRQLFGCFAVRVRMWCHRNLTTRAFPLARTSPTPGRTLCSNLLFPDFLSVIFGRKASHLTNRAVERRRALASTRDPNRMAFSHLVNRAKDVASRIAPLSGGGRIENLFFEFAMIFFRDRAPLVLR